MLICSTNAGSSENRSLLKELYDKYKQAKDNGANEAELDAISQQILEVEYRNNPLMMQRMIVLKQLEPYPNKPHEQVLSLYEKGLLDKIKVLIKLNFSTYIDRFERENINIIAFGSNIQLSDKVKVIYKKLEDYAREERTTGIADTQTGVAGWQNQND